MKLFAKLFAGVMAVLCLSLALSGYLMISMSFRLSYENKSEQAMSRFQMTEYLVEQELKENGFHAMQEDGFFSEITEMSVRMIHGDGMMAVTSGENVLYSSFPGGFVFPEASASAVTTALKAQGDAYILTVCGVLRAGEEEVCLYTGSYITDIIEQRRQMTKNYREIYLYVCLMGAVMTFTLSLFIVRPLNRLSKSAAQIAGGDYSVRVNVRTKDEVGELGENFNRMAQAVEAGVEELRQEAVRKEDFVGNFAHELKTPLTSVIGYADMICSQPLSETEVKQAAQYILDEGMRLEELSRKLMDLTVLNRQEFLLETLPAGDVLRHTAALIAPVLQKRGVCLHLTIEEADIRVEFDLFETLLLNLLDNAMKADARNIYMDGRCFQSGYRIMVNDDGRGIPAKELGRITEAFYMVDKSRSRKQHGAGLGLALVSRIAEIHKATLKFASREGIGTKVAVTLPGVPLRKGEGRDEED